MEPPSRRRSRPPPPLPRPPPHIRHIQPQRPLERPTIGGKTYYWIIFSSKRNLEGNPQLYITGLVVDGSGLMESHGALYLWNQPEAENNHTPAWDFFNIPSPPPQ